MDDDEDPHFWEHYYYQFRSLDEEDLAFFEEIPPVVHNEVHAENAQAALAAAQIQAPLNFEDAQNAAEEAVVQAPLNFGDDQNAEAEIQAALNFGDVQNAQGGAAAEIQAGPNFGEAREAEAALALVQAAPNNAEAEAAAPLLQAAPNNAQALNDEAAAPLLQAAPSFGEARNGQAGAAQAQNPQDTDSSNHGKTRRHGKKENNSRYHPYLRDQIKVAAAAVLGFAMGYFVRSQK